MGIDMEAIKAIDKILIQQIASRIIEKFNPLRIILFGSHSRHEATLNSDIDLFIEMDTDKRPPERSIEISRLFGLRNWAMDIFVYTPDEVSHLKSIHGTLLSSIESEGEVLYDRRKD
jgi:predicted nucleotidyltransferase